MITEAVILKISLCMMLGVRRDSEREMHPLLFQHDAVDLVSCSIADARLLLPFTLKKQTNCNSMIFSRVSLPLLVSGLAVSPSSRPQACHVRSFTSCRVQEASFLACHQTFQC